MLKRVITAVVLIAILLPILFLSWKVQYLIPALMAVMALIAVFEIFRCVGKTHDYLASVPAYLLAVGIPLGSAWAEGVASYFLVCAALLTVYLLYLFAVAIFRRGVMAFSEVATLFTAVLYIVLSFTSLALLRHQTPHGGYLYLLVFFGAWVTDTFAYFTGRLFGKHKLNPEISPKKTVEGSIGGIVFCVISFAVFGIIMQFVWHMNVHYVLLCSAGVICSVVSQIGDLITSLIKREHDVKDYGNIFPGHGGVLDRFDSVLAIAPVMLILCNLSLLGNELSILA